MSKKIKTSNSVAMQVTLLDRMGDDLTVVNAARCSFGKRKMGSEFIEVEYNDQMHRIAKVDSGDTKLIKYLAKHNHWTPFGHGMLQFHIKAPIFVARQLGKHQTGLVWNEVSRRYVDDEPEFYNPDEWRLRAKNVKQGSSDETKEYDISEHNEKSLKLYNDMLEQGIAPEMARMVLPQNMMTQWFWSGSLYAFVRICKLRQDPSTQKETRIIADLIADECKKIFPVSWEAFFQ